MAFISPPVEDKADHARLLLGLADDVNHVQTTMDGPTGLAFVVPEYLAELYVQALEHQNAGDSAESADDQQAPVKRKPGRPKNTDKG